METDGAQDEAPRFPKTLATAVNLFRLLDLGVLLHGVNAAGVQPRRKKNDTSFS